ncbi:MAG: sodium:proline symporter, partial [Alphaproteobacteria bacterium]
MQSTVLIVLFAAVILASLLVAPRRATVEGFFGGANAAGRAPGLWVLVLSQVTTWIFARSLMNAAILGYFYGIAGTLAYAAYYGSFLTGGYIVGHLRRGGARSVQDWLGGQFGSAGTTAYNLVIGLRLLSEVFANLLVVALIFEAVWPGSGTLAVLIVAALGFGYSAWGGLSAALRTDVVQMLIFLVVFGLALGALLLSPGFELGAVLSAPGVSGPYNGWVLLAVALLQVFSYPAHDPVMMDRGFLADEATTRASFLHAFWISTLCIIGFGFFGIQASLTGAAYEGELIGTWGQMFPGW